MKKYLGTIILMFFICLTNVSALEIDIKSNNVLLYNLKDEKIMYEKNSEENTSIASLTKIVTVLVAIENIDDVHEKITLTPEIFKDLALLKASVAGFEVGEIVTYEDLLYGAMLPSGADATNALAVNIFGSEEKFVNKMNELMSKLNIKNTYFTNTTGLDEKAQKANLNDLLKVILYGFENEYFTKIFNARTYITSNGSLTMKSTLNNYEKRFAINTDIINGSKTGFTSKAGLCLLSYADNDELELLLITTNAPVEDNLFPYNVTDALKIYNYYFDNYDYFKILNTNDVVTSINTKYSKVKEVDVIYKGKDIEYLLPNNYNNEDIVYSYDLKEYVSFLTDKNKKVGTFNIKYKDETILEDDLYLKDQVNLNIFYLIKDHILVFSFLVITLFLLTLKRRKKQR